MGRLERLQLLCHLLFEDIESARRRNKAKERWRWIKRARAEFWMRLQANEEYVICEEREKR